MNIQQQEEKFWKRRNNQAAIWIFINTLSNIFFQSSALYAPISKLYFKVNIAYMAVSAIQLIGVYLNFKKNLKNINNLNLTISILRNAIRFYDFEESCVALGSIYWQGILCIGFAGCLFNIHIQINFCQMDYRKYIFSSVLLIFFSISLLYGIQMAYYKQNNLQIQFSFQRSGFLEPVFICVAIILIFEIICSSLNVELFNNMQNKIKKQMEFKYILDHLEE